MHTHQSHQTTLRDVTYQKLLKQTERQTDRLTSGQQCTSGPCTFFHSVWLGDDSSVCGARYAVVTTGASPGFFIGGKTEGPKAESGMGFLGRGQQPLLTSYGFRGSAVSSPSGVRDGAPTGKRFSTIFSTQDGLSWHYSTVNCGLSCSHWGPRPPCSPRCVRPWVTTATRLGFDRRATADRRAEVARAAVESSRSQLCVVASYSRRSSQTCRPRPVLCA